MLNLRLKYNDGVLYWYQIKKVTCVNTRDRIDQNVQWTKKVPDASTDAVPKSTDPAHHFGKTIPMGIGKEASSSSADLPAMDGLGDRGRRGRKEKHKERRYERPECAYNLKPSTNVGGHGHERS
jgi:hypothetical protein